MSVTVHEFNSTREAYAACQCDENVKDGDVLVIRSERVVGVAETWPVAVTAEYGELHLTSPESTVGCWAAGARKPILVAAWKAAVAKAVELGFALGDTVL